MKLGPCEVRHRSLRAPYDVLTQMIVRLFAVPFLGSLKRGNTATRKIHKVNGPSKNDTIVSYILRFRTRKLLYGAS